MSVFESAREVALQGQEYLEGVCRHYGVVRATVEQQSRNMQTWLWTSSVWHASLKNSLAALLERHIVCLLQNVCTTLTIQHGAKPSADLSWSRGFQPRTGATTTVLHGDQTVAFLSSMSGSLIMYGIGNIVPMHLAIRDPSSALAITLNRLDFQFAKLKRQAIFRYHRSLGGAFATWNIP